MRMSLRRTIATVALLAGSLGLLGVAAAPAGASVTVTNKCNGSASTVCYHYYRLVPYGTVYYQRYAVNTYTKFVSACDYIPGSPYRVTCGGSASYRPPNLPNGYLSHHPVFIAAGKYYVCGVVGCSETVQGKKPVGYTTGG